MTETTPIELVTRLDGEHPESIWNAMVTIGIEVPSVEKQITKMFFLPTHLDGVPVEFEASMADGKVIAKVTSSQESRKHLCYAAAYDVVFRPVDAKDASLAVDLMQQFVKAYREERRDLCLSAGSFLGQENYPWNHLNIGVMKIAAFQTFREELFSDWAEVLVGDPRTGTLRFERFKNFDGVEESVCTNARYFYRHKMQNRRLILDVHRNGTLEVAAPDLSQDEIQKLFKTIEDKLGSIFGAISCAISAKGEAVLLDNPVAWDDLFLDTETLESLRNEVSNFFDNREMFERLKIPHRRGLLLYGVPGTGKTMFGKVLVSTLENCLFMWITASDVNDAASVDAIFSIARDAERAVLFFEDLDMYASHRGRIGSKSTLGELMVQMDGMHSNEGILVVATTNDLEAIEPALKDRPSRFDQVIEFRAPPENVRRGFLHSMLSEFGVTDAQLNSIASQTHGFTGAQIKELAILAKSSAAQRGSIVIEKMDLDVATKKASAYKAVPTGFAGGAVEADDDPEDYYV